MTERIGGMQRRQELPRKVADRLTRRLAPDIEVRGLETLEEVRRLSEENVPIIFMPNHQSNTDAFVISSVLKRNGFEDIDKRLVFLLGMKLERNLIGKMFFNHAVNRIRVWSPSLATKDDREKIAKERTNDQAQIDVKEALRQGFHLVVFPEATRSRTGQLTKGQPGVFIYISKNTVIIPVGITGTKDILAPGKIIPKRAQVSITFGPPINLDFLFKDSEEGLDSIGRRDASNKVMRQLAYLLPEEYRGVYA